MILLTTNDKALVSLFCLYVADQEEMYKNDYAKFKYIKNWLFTKTLSDSVISLNPEQFLFSAPDICSQCGEEFGLCKGGRVRMYCPHCILKENDFPFKVRFFPWYNPTYLAFILQIKEEFMQYHLSIALHLYKRELEKRKLK